MVDHCLRVRGLCFKVRVYPKGQHSMGSDLVALLWMSVIMGLCMGGHCRIRIRQVRHVELNLQAHTHLRWTPRLRWRPEHSRQMKMPLLTDTHCGECVPHSKQFCAKNAFVRVCIMIKNNSILGQIMAISRLGSPTPQN